MTLKVARRRPWLAGLLQVILPGLGSVYVGRPVRGLVLFVVSRFVSFSSIPLLLRLPSRLGLIAIVITSLLITVILAVDGVRGAKAENPHYKLASYNRWYVYILIFICIGTIDALFITNFTRSYLFQAMQPSTPSMEPSVLIGDHFLVDKTAYWFSRPRRGDLVTYRTPAFPEEVIFVKRIVGLPGETIEIRERVVFIDGKRLDEPYIRFLRPGEESYGNSVAPTPVPDDSYFVLGDTRDNSNDSRFTGAVPREELLGKVRTVFLSTDPETGRVRWDRIGKVLE